jgi:hypothetical protein
VDYIPRLRLFLPTYFTESLSKLFKEIGHHSIFREAAITPQIDYGYVDFFELIGQQHLLMHISNELVLLKVNYETWEVSVVSNPDHGLECIYRVIIDQSDPSRVLIYNFTGVVTGKLVGDQIVFDPPRELNINGIRCAKLIGNQLFGLHVIGRDENNWFWQYRKIDLSTLTKETIDVPLALNTSPLPTDSTVSLYSHFLIR